MKMEEVKIEEIHEGDNLEESIEYMAQNSDKNINDPDILFHKEIVERNKDNKNINEILSKQFRPTSIFINTAGSYLWGCSQNYYGNVSKTCSPLCSEGINYETTTCQYQIWTYDINLKNTRQISSSQAYIYVPNVWDGFKISDIENLRNHGVLFASVFTTLDSKHKSILPMTSLENLPIIKKRLVLKKTEESNLYWKIFIFLSLCLIIFLFIFKENFFHTN